MKEQWSTGRHTKISIHTKKLLNFNAYTLRGTLMWKEMSDYNKEYPLGASLRFLFVTQELSSISSICEHLQAIWLNCVQLCASQYHSTIILGETLFKYDFVTLIISRSCRIFTIFMANCYYVKKFFFPLRFLHAIAQKFSTKS